MIWSKPGNINISNISLSPPLPGSNPSETLDLSQGQEERVYKAEWALCKWLTRQLPVVDLGNNELSSI